MRGKMIVRGERVQGRTIPRPFGNGKAHPRFTAKNGPDHILLIVIPWLKDREGGVL